MAQIVSLHISSSLYPGLESFFVACLIIFTQIRATIGIPNSSDPEKGSLVTYPEKSAVFTIMPALNRGREGIQLLHLDMQYFEGFFVKEQVIEDVPNTRAVFIVYDQGEKQNISSYTNGSAEHSTVGQ